MAAPHRENIPGSLTHTQAHISANSPVGAENTTHTLTHTHKHASTHTQHATIANMRRTIVVGTDTRAVKQDNVMKPKKGSPYAHHDEIYCDGSWAKSRCSDTNPPNLSHKLSHARSTLTQEVPSPSERFVFAYGHQLTHFCWSLLSGCAMIFFLLFNEAVHNRISSPSFTRQNAWRCRFSRPSRS
jgi:hypothetical protein